MKRLLVDAGPLIALFDKDDQHHQRVMSQLERFEEILVTTWPVMTEVSHMLGFSIRAQLDFLHWTTDGGLEIYPLTDHDFYRLCELTETYQDVPMDLADASLVVVSEHLNTDRILSIDSDFQIFQNRFKSFLVNVSG